MTKPLTKELMRTLDTLSREVDVLMKLGVRRETIGEAVNMIARQISAETLDSHTEARFTHRSVDFLVSAEKTPRQ